jgi:hypothetical protein
MLRVLSLGAGVQSTTLALMAARGEIEAPDCAIFADTGWEPKQVYDHLAWLMSPNVLTFPVNIVTAGDIREGIRNRRSARSGQFAAVPWHIVNPDGSFGMGVRQCSAEYKLEPIAKEVRRLLGKPHPARVAPGSAVMLLGISADEAQRMKPSRRKFMVNTYPLVDRWMTRRDCLKWLERHGYPRPPKSACIGCPYTSNDRWRDRRDNQPEEWAEAIAIDRVLREGDARGTRGLEYVHRSCVPLDQVDLSTAAERGQPDLFGNECEGVCGV